MCHIWSDVVRLNQESQPKGGIKEECLLRDLFLWFRNEEEKMNPLHMQQRFEFRLSPDLSARRLAGAIIQRENPSILARKHSTRSSFNF